MRVSVEGYPLLYPHFLRLSAERCGQLRRVSPRAAGIIAIEKEKPGLLRMSIEVINH